MKKLIILLALVTLTSCSAPEYGVNEIPLVIEDPKTESFYFETTKALLAQETLATEEYHSFEFVKGTHVLKHGYVKSGIKMYEELRIEERDINELILYKSITPNYIHYLHDNDQRMFFYPTTKKMILMVTFEPTGQLLQRKSFY
jgi:hypothetical protein